MGKHRWLFPDLTESDDVCKDFIEKLKETKQVYIVSHDVPISVSKHLYSLLNEKRKELAERKGVPEVQCQLPLPFGRSLKLKVV